MKFKQRLIGAIGVLVVLGLIGQMSVAYADADYDKAKANAPQGLPLSNYFKFGDFAGNSAKVVDTGRSDGTQMVQLTDAKAEVGTIWTGDDYALDLNKNATASMWMYFGNYPVDAGDGMAFVIQNDTRGVNAVSRASDGTVGNGQTLGVWGVDDNPKGTAAQIASRGIQNSWALEFDTYLNSNNFDLRTGVAKQHIASNYPGYAGSYGSGGDFFYLNHNGLMKDSSDPNYLLSSRDNTWKHLTLKWDAAASTITYAFNDKNPATGDAKTATGTQTVTIDRSKIDPNGTGKARWGFTGSTGELWENNLVIFEQLPGIVNSSASATITNTRTDKQIATGDAIDAGTPLRADYRLDYTSGSKSWTGISAKINLPNNFAANYAKVTYANGKTTLLDTSQLSDQALTAAIDDLNTTNNVATVSVYGSATNSSTSSAVSVPAATSHFNGSNALTMASTPAYMINPRNSWQLGLYFGAVGTGTTTTSMTTTADGVDLTGYFTFAQDNTPNSGASINGSAVDLYPSINGKALSSVKVSSGTSRQFSYHVAAADLASGENRVTLTAGYTASTGTIYSTPITATVTAGALGFQSVSDTLNFDETLTGSTETIAPVSQPDVSVSDTRGGQNSWTVKAALTGMSTNFPGTLIYQPGDGSSVSLNNQAATIDTGKAASSATDVSDDWSQTWTGASSKGLFLKVPGSSTSGNYNGQINWELDDTPS
ncbi:hypothetical protein LEBR102806_10645 [Levilactobacillus brevis]|uniref:lectin-like domain-containing protein n=2 Tax=Levilactobacillus brevis TaxID=1580 RepID=UPI0005AD17FB|nr:hypothetical protein [Levilactobacillus brevis]KIO98279.1 extracellular protein [Levilactobacillus brevis]MCT3573012.1 hypothetical protein [Levilactobacillus brevis]SQG75370.1 cell surface protein, CscC family [Levilactobacillus brevis]